MPSTARFFALRVHDLEKLERGDIIVFTAETPELAGTTLIKRLIGLPGDHVEIDENGTVTINGGSAAGKLCGVPVCHSQ